MNESFIDFHCHPQLKPYGKSFQLKPWGQNTVNKKNENSIWFYDPPKSLLERLIQLFTGIVKFTQSDCTTLTYGNVKIVCASLYPIERGFFENDLGDGKISDLTNNFVTSVSKQRVNYIQGIKNYFEDVEREYDYYQQLHLKPVKIENSTYTYVLVSSYAEIEAYQKQNPEQDNTLFIIITIEGLHVLNSDLTNPPDEVLFLNNLATVKSWTTPPFFVTFAHHFYNGLCGHAKSLTGLVGNFTNQSYMLGEGFSPLGRKVVKALLDNTAGKRILVDVKHMSARGRKEYYELLETEYSNDSIPVIVSHGACNGYRNFEEKIVDGKETGFKLLAEDINFYDHEIVLIAQSKGIFGLQLDERRIANQATIRAVKHSLQMNKIRHYRAELLWNQIQHIAELLDRNDLFAWDCMVIGSDFDGIINPLNGYLSSESLPDLQQYVERYAYNYMEDRGKTVLKSFNRLSPSEIVNRIFSLNGLDFLKRCFHL